VKILKLGSPRRNGPRSRARPLVIPAWSQTTSPAYAIKGGKVFSLAGPAIENGTVIIRDGKNRRGRRQYRPFPRTRRSLTQPAWKFIPGMFDPVTQIGLNEVSAVNATVDVSELGDYNPELVRRHRRESRQRAYSRHPPRTESPP